MSDLLIATADPDFAEMALAEFQEATGNAVVIFAPLAPGVYPIKLPYSFWDLATRWQQQPPIFVRHICPAQLQLLSVTLPEWQAHTESVFADLFEPEYSFSVQTCQYGDWPFKPYDVNMALAETIQKMSDAKLDVRRPRQILSVVAANRPDNPPIAYIGLSLAEHNLSDWAGGVRRFKREQGQISRAEFKLLEALEQFKIKLPPHGVALDLGAAPGGWTHVLRQKEQYVTAIDPAGLHPNLEKDPGVRHFRQTAEAYLESIPDQYDLIVNDMRLDARDSARLMVKFRPYIYPGGSAIMILKLPAGNRETIINHSFKILRTAYHIQKARHLFHNRSEITLHLSPSPK